MTITLIVTGQGAFGGESLGAGNDVNDAHGKLGLTKFGLFERNVALSDTPVQFSGEHKQGAAIFRTGFNPFTEGVNPTFTSRAAIWAEIEGRAAESQAWQGSRDCSEQLF
jgi:hypothetical protein